MKRIGIISLGYAWLPCEPGPSRFYYIARMFAECGYDVDLVSSGFQHFEKKVRNKELILRQKYPFKTTFIDVPPYKKNISLRRVYSNRVAKENVKKYIQKQKYDIVYCSIPANDVAATVAKHCYVNNIPLIVDIEDLWPEAMGMVTKRRLLYKVACLYFFKDAETVYQYADAVIGTSDEYTKRAFQKQHHVIPQKTIYVGCDLDVFDSGAERYVEEIQKAEDEFWVTYAGSIGRSYDIPTLIEAAKVIRDQGLTNIRIMILGTGVMKDEMESLAKNLGCTNVSFLGYIAYPKMAAYLKKSDVLLNSFVKGAPQSIVNKVGDYLAAGKPMINTLESQEFMKLVKTNEFGINIEPENAEALADAIAQYAENKVLREKQAENARRTAEQYFDRKKTYRQMVKLADKLLEEKRASV